MKVYHGSTSIVTNPLAAIGRKHLDFGQGFYVTDLEEQAASWANRPANAGLPKVLNIYELDLDAIRASGFRYKHFSTYDAEWLDFVVANRKGEKLWKDYDIIEGGIANDRVFNTIELYLAGLIPTEEALQKLRYELPNNQICILRQSIIDKHLRFTGSKPITT